MCIIQAKERINQLERFIEIKRRDIRNEKAEISMLEKLIKKAED